MNIFLITAWYPTLYTPNQGVFIREHARAIVSLGHNLTVFHVTSIHASSFFKIIKEETSDARGFIVHSFIIQSCFYKWFYITPFFLYWFLSKQVNKKISDKGKPDLIHSQVLYPAGIWGYWLSKKHGIPHIITEHWSNVTKFMRTSLFSGLGKKAYNDSVAITTVSSFLKETLIPFVKNQEKIFIIPNVVDTGLFIFKPKPSFSPVHFIAVAHWKKPKMPELFVQALTAVKKENKESFILHIVGEGPLLENIKRNASSCPFQIFFHGQLEKNKLAELFTQCHFFLHASSVETFSVVIAEALATGTPVVASRVGAIPELLNDFNGILVENTIPAWVEGIKKILSMNFNPVNISELYRERFSYQYVSRQFNNVYYLI